MTEQTLTALYDSREDAEAARDDLVALGVPSSSIAVRGAESSTTTTTQEDRGFWASLFLPDDDRETYAEGVRRGGYLLTASVSGDLLDQAHDALEQSGAVDVDTRIESWRKEGWSSGTIATTATTATAGSTAAGFAATEGVAARATGAVGTGAVGNEGSIKLVEEQLKIGKRAVERGGVRVRSYIVETPVEEQVTLRDERITLERRPVDRAATPGELDAFQERTIELTEHDEEAVVSKDVRVKEELVIGKEAEERVETVRDKVRRTEVEVEDTRTGETARGDVIGGTTTSTTRDRSGS